MKAPFEKKYAEYWQAENRTSSSTQSPTGCSSNSGTNSKNPVDVAKNFIEDVPKAKNWGRRQHELGLGDGKTYSKVLQSSIHIPFQEITLEPSYDLTAEIGRIRAYDEATRCYESRSKEYKITGEIRQVIRLFCAHVKAWQCENNRNQNTISLFGDISEKQRRRLLQQAKALCEFIRDLQARGWTWEHIGCFLFR